jgi:hypothetical protein
MRAVVQGLGIRLPMPAARRWTVREVGGEHVPRPRRKAEELETIERLEREARRRRRYEDYLAPLQRTRRWG